MTAGSTELGTLRTQRAALLSQADVMQGQIEKLSPIVVDYHKARLSNQRPKEPTKQIQEHQRTIHERASKVKAANEVSVQIGALEVLRLQLLDREAKLEAELAPYVTVLTEVAAARSALNEIDNALSSAGGNQVAIHAYRSALSALSRPEGILTELGTLRTRLAELGE